MLSHTEGQMNEATQKKGREEGRKTARSGCGFYGCPLTKVKDRLPSPRTALSWELGCEDREMQLRQQRQTLLLSCRSKLWRKRWFGWKMRLRLKDTSLVCSGLNFRGFRRTSLFQGPRTLRGKWNHDHILKHMWQYHGHKITLQHFRIFFSSTNIKLSWQHLGTYSLSSSRWKWDDNNHCYFPWFSFNSRSDTQLFHQLMT